MQWRSNSLTLLPNPWFTSWIISILRYLSATTSLLPLYISCPFATLNFLQALLKFLLYPFIEIPPGNFNVVNNFPPKLNQRGFYFFFTFSSSAIFLRSSKSRQYQQWHCTTTWKFSNAFRIQRGNHYNALHFKVVIIYRRSHNLPINNDSLSHYMLGNFDWGVIINRYTGNYMFRTRCSVKYVES